MFIYVEGDTYERVFSRTGAHMQDRLAPSVSALYCRGQVRTNHRLSESEFSGIDGGHTAAAMMWNHPGGRTRCSD